jgi:CubicO group peptidase (beta-lactamase class C family)
MTSALLAVSLCLLTLPAAAASPDPGAAKTVWPTKAWETSTPEEQGLDSAALAALVTTVGNYKQDSLLIVRHGKIVADVYYGPYEAGIPHDLRSITKSVIGTLTAIEIRDGLLDSVDHPIVDLFPDKKISSLDGKKRAMTVQNLLDMASGIEWQERAYTPDESITRMHGSPDRTAFVLDQPMSSTPGTRFYYNSGNSYVLSAIITKKTGESAFKFAEHALFAPLGISSARWGRPDAQGVSDGESGLFLTPYDMARLGYLYLHDGVWDGMQLIPRSWVARARAGPITANSGFNYGNLWWSRPGKGAYMALGRHSQVILVLPNLDLVAVMTGHLEDGVYYPLDELIDDISSAVKSDGPRIANSAGRSLLVASIRRAAAGLPSPAGETPAISRRISGKIYELGENELRVKTLSLTLDASNPSWEITTSDREPAHPPGRYAGPLGLDGAFRKSPPASDGIDAVRGRWLDDRRFLLERQVLGHGEVQTWTLTFSGKKVDIAFEDTDGVKAELHGEAKD